ncbi:MAG: hypothetical protein LAT63_08510 [Marinobacter sp.]|nr:hypothetical protein [Marinobacter sp.]
MLTAWKTRIKVLLLPLVVMPVLSASPALANSNDALLGTTAVIEPAGRDFVDSLKQLYITESAVDALILHANDVFEQAAWRENPRLIRASERPDVSYRVFLTPGEAGSLTIQESRRGGSGQVRVSTLRINVFGISPILTWACESGDNACRIFDPRDGTRMLQIARDPGKAEELTRTLGLLIRQLQRPD